MLWFLAFLLLSPEAPEFEAIASTGTSVGTVVAVANDQVALETIKGKITYRTSELLRIRRRGAAPVEAPTTGVWVELTDGSSLVGRDYQAHGAEAVFTSAAGQTIKLPLRVVSMVRLHSPTPRLAEQWAEIADGRRVSDTLVLRKQSSLDYFNGVLGNVGADSVSFDTDGEKVDVKRSRLEGFFYASRPGADKMPAALCAVVDRSGSRWQAATLVLAGDAALAGKVLTLTTPAGATVSLPWAEIDQLQYNVQYLSDLKPEVVEYTPFLAGDKTSTAEHRFHQPRFNAGQASGQLRLAGVSYDKGISLFARSELVYRLPERFSQFQAIAGLDGLSNVDARARLVISGDDRVLFDQTIVGATATPLSLDLRGINRLKIVVDFAGGEVLDRVNLCDPRLLK